MKWRQNLYFFCIIGLMQALFLDVVFGNGVVILHPEESPGYRILALTIMFIIGTSIEFRLLNFNDNDIVLRRIELLKPVFKVNLVTFPLTQILAYIISLYFPNLFWLYILVIEIFVIIIEWKLLKIELHKKNDKIHSKKILKNMIKVNLISFLLGLIVFIPIEYIYFY